MSSVELRKLCKAYGNHTVVPDFDLKIQHGEFLSLLGPSGCGKTTILRMIAGLDDPTAGLIHIDGEPVYDASARVNVVPEKRNLGMVFQSYAVWPHLSVLENVVFPLRCRKIPKAEREEKALEALRSVRLQDYARRKPHQLSGGQQQRVALARALVARPRVLLLDEPLSNLDAVLRDEMCEQLVELRKLFPITMIYVTHDQKEANWLSDRIALLNEGRLVQLGTPQAIREEPVNEFVRKFLRV